MPRTAPFIQIRLDMAEGELIDVLMRRYGLPNKSSVVRFALRRTLELPTSYILREQPPAPVQDTYDAYYDPQQDATYDGGDR